MITHIENGEIYAPEPLGKNSILIVGNQIPKVGEFERSAVKSLGVDYEVTALAKPHSKKPFFKTAIETLGWSARKD